MRVSQSVLRAFGEVISEKEEKKKTFSYGTVHVIDGEKMVKIDGSEDDVYTPIDILMDCEAGDRVSVEIVNHRVLVNGNISSPASARKASGIITDVGFGGNQGMILGVPDSTCYIFIKSDPIKKENSILFCEKDGVVICSFSKDSIDLKSTSSTIKGVRIATEDDINSVKELISSVQKKVEDTMANMVTVENAANQALQSANNAVSKAEGAEAEANQALTTANNAVTKIEQVEKTFDTNLHYVQTQLESRINSINDEIYNIKARLTALEAKG